MGVFRYTLLLTLYGFFCADITAQKMNTNQYIEEFKFAAMQEMKIYGIPASVTLAQGILESASGNSKLAKDCNNHFGIKCRKNWTGNFCLADDDAQDECFRGYGSAMESYRDHSLFLKGASRYDFLFSLPTTDYKAWAHGLRQAGYATNPAYGNIIISVVERYRLSMDDSRMILGEDYNSPDTAASRLIQKHGLPAVIALKNQKPEDIAKLYDMGSWQIYKYNDLKNGEELKPGEIIYLKPKKRKATEDFHTVKEGETLRDISQLHAVKLKKLEKFNQIVASKPLKPGEIIYLREKKMKDSLKKSFFRKV
jgi:LysM repeat protein